MWTDHSREVGLVPLDLHIVYPEVKSRQVRHTHQITCRSARCACHNFCAGVLYGLGPDRPAAITAFGAFGLSATHALLQILPG